MAKEGRSPLSNTLVEIKGLLCDLSTSRTSLTEQERYILKHVYNQLLGARDLLKVLNGGDTEKIRDEALTLEQDTQTLAKLAVLRTFYDMTALHHG